MSELPEAIDDRAAWELATTHRGPSAQPSTWDRQVVRVVLGAAVGPLERAIIAKVCAWLRETADPRDAALEHGALRSEHIAADIEEGYPFSHAAYHPSNPSRRT